MDELDLLKKDWKKQESSLPKLTYTEIYKLLLKKSSSIVKWIFIISILEFVLFVSLEIFARVTGGYENYEKIGLGTGFSVILSIISFCIFIYFIIRFYINYKKIQSTDSVKMLMETILKTRRTVKRYVLVTLLYMSLILLFVFGFVLFYSPDFQELQGESSKDFSKTALGFILLLCTILIVGFLGGFYYLLYGLLTRRLNKNYKQLSKLDM